MKPSKITYKTSAPLRITQKLWSPRGLVLAKGGRVHGGVKRGMKTINKNVLPISPLQLFSKNKKYIMFDFLKKDVKSVSPKRRNLNIKTLVALIPKKIPIRHISPSIRNPRLAKIDRHQSKKSKADYSGDFCLRVRKTKKTSSITNLQGLLSAIKTKETVKISKKSTNKVLRERIMSPIAKNISENLRYENLTSVLGRNKEALKNFIGFQELKKSNTRRHNTSHIQKFEVYKSMEEDGNDRSILRKFLNSDLLKESGESCFPDLSNGEESKRSSSINNEIIEY
ncbi:unnamed protein product [Moneuplotes crassus]|uniref:Uncharacterized protein n=1 Tax=Euplotes crassus TaxID=5936 RepID=A0AAD2D8J9_EUPCR|nr:unnamed protein product [Moneuplotes crassus]